MRSVCREVEGNMSIEIDSKLLAAAVKGLGLTVPVRSARLLADGRVLLETRDGRHVWEPPKKKAAPPKAGQVPSGVGQAPKSVSKPVATRKRAKPAGKTEVTSDTDD